MEEFELKFLEVDVPELEKKLLAMGAEKVAEYEYMRVLMDYPDFRLNKAESWIRVRTDGMETTLTYKQSIKEKEGDKSSKAVGMKEIEVEVDSYEKTFELLKSIGMVIKREEKNRRVRYKKGDVEFDIDFWPFIPPYVEIESTSYEKAKKAAKELGFDPEGGLIGTAADVYKRYGFNKDEYSSITFEGLVKK